MKPMKKRLLSLLLTLVTILSLLPTSAFAASKTGSGIQITQDQAYWSTRLLANGTPYSYRPPLADGKLVYCMDSGLGYHYATKSFLDSYPFLSDAEAQRFGTGKEEIGKCPRCGSPVYVGKGNFYCSNRECSFCLWEDNKFFSSKKKKLTKRIAKELLDKGWCRVTGLYTPKKPQLYDAVIRLDDSGGKYVSFKMEFDR